MIAHIDMDAFFATCEETRNPELADRPLVVCNYTRDGSSGTVTTASYEARENGIESAMPLSEARNRADENTVFIETDHGFYRKKSEQVMAVLGSFTGKIQKTSIDEAYFRLEGEELSKAKKIQAGVEALGLSASIGIAPNKLLAKLASEEHKPGGIVRVGKDEAQDFLDGKKVRELHGVGEKTEERLTEAGIEFVDDLREVNNSFLSDLVGRDRAASLKQKARGKGSRKLESGERKQISTIKTMERNSRQKRYMMKEVEALADRLSSRIESRNRAFRGVTLVGVDIELNRFTRSKKIDTSESRSRIVESADQLLERLLDETDTEFRRLGLRVTDLVDREAQTTLNSF